MPKKIICSRCQEEKDHHGHGMCKSCYMRWYTSEKRRKEKHAEQMRKWRTENPDKAKAIEDRRSQTAKRKAWSAKYNRKYYDEHAEDLRQYQRDWRSDKANTSTQTEYKMRYKHRKVALPDTLTNEEWQEILDEYHHLCAYCETSDELLIEEHWIPVSRGGGRTKENIVPSCARCNSRKGTMTGEEFLDLLDLEEWEHIQYLIKEYDNARVYDTVSD